MLSFACRPTPTWNSHARRLCLTSNCASLRHYSENDIIRPLADKGFQDSKDEVSPGTFSKAWCPHRVLLVQGLIRPRSALETLELLGVPPVWVSSWNTETWKRLLGTVKKLRVSLYSSGGIYWWCSSTAYHRTYTKIVEFLYYYLTDVTEFSLTADDCFFGLSHRSLHDCTLPFSAEAMPLLQKLKLERGYFTKQLAKFIASHSQTLE
jgi:hypothetical protein